MTYKYFFTGWYTSITYFFNRRVLPKLGFLLVASVPRTNYYFTVLGFCHASTVLPRLQGFAMLGTDCVFENKHTLVTYSVYLHKSYQLSNVSLFQGFAMLARTTCFEINTYLHSATVLSGWQGFAMLGRERFAMLGRDFGSDAMGMIRGLWFGKTRFGLLECVRAASGIIPIACISKYVIERTRAKLNVFPSK